MIGDPKLRVAVQRPGPPIPRQGHLDQFAPGDVVQGVESGNLYLVIAGVAGDLATVHLCGSQAFAIGPTRGGFRGVAAADLAVRLLGGGC